jgi:hypothetical protein
VGKLEISDAYEFAVDTAAAFAVPIVVGVIPIDVRAEFRKVDNVDDSILWDSLSAKCPFQVEAVTIDKEENYLILTKGEAKKVKEIIAGCF